MVGVSGRSFPSSAARPNPIFSSLLSFALPGRCPVSWALSPESRSPRGQNPDTEQRRQTVVEEHVPKEPPPHPSKTVVAGRLLARAPPPPTRDHPTRSAIPIPLIFRASSRPPPPPALTPFILSTPSTLPPPPPTPLLPVHSAIRKPSIATLAQTALLLSRPS